MQINFIYKSWFPNGYQTTHSGMNLKLKIKTLLKKEWHYGLKKFFNLYSQLKKGNHKKLFKYRVKRAQVLNFFLNIRKQLGIKKETIIFFHIIYFFLQLNINKIIESEPRVIAEEDKKIKGLLPHILSSYSRFGGNGRTFHTN